MAKLPVVTVTEVLRALRRDGWEIVRTTGHHLLRHPSKPGRVTVPNHPSETIKPKTLRSIINQAGLTIDEFRDLL